MTLAALALAVTLSVPLPPGVCSEASIQAAVVEADKLLSPVAQTLVGFRGPGDSLKQQGDGLNLLRAAADCVKMLSLWRIAPPNQTSPEWDGSKMRFRGDGLTAIESGDTIRPGWVTTQCLTNDGSLVYDTGAGCPQK